MPAEYDFTTKEWDDLKGLLDRITFLQTSIYATLTRQKKMGRVDLDGFQALKREAAEIGNLIEHADPGILNILRAVEERRNAQATAANLSMRSEGR